jgi:hypothetical protein
MRLKTDKLDHNVIKLDFLIIWENNVSKFHKKNHTEINKLTKNGILFYNTWSYIMIKNIGVGELRPKL